jgi:hAT family C-terminal dimerisation region
MNSSVTRAQPPVQRPPPTQHQQQVPTISTSTSQDDNVEVVQGGLFAGYKRRRVATGSEPVSVSRQVDRYFDKVDSEAESVSIDCLDFWVTHKERFPALYQLATSLLSAPASSAPVERVFSHGGIMMRPHRASLGDTTLAQLIFLKCNRLR